VGSGAEAVVNPAFQRRELTGPEQRTAVDYTTGGLSDPLTMAHAPQYVQTCRDLARAVSVGNDLVGRGDVPDESDPFGQAKLALNAIGQMQEAFLHEGSEEAAEFEALIRQGRSPAPEPALSEDVRYQRAREALERTP
jgi:hypothetical protein